MIYFKILMAFLLSFLFVFIIMPYFIKYLKSISFNQNVNQYALEQYKQKEKTPIMGGILFVLGSIFISFIVDFNTFKNFDTLIVILSFFGYGLIGFLDDFLIVIRGNNDGLKASYKFLLQLALIIIFFYLYKDHSDLSIIVPIFKTHLNISYLYIILVLFMFVGSSNAVNLTDGMDGLAAGCSFISLIPFLIFAIIDKQFYLAIFISSLLGSLLAYLKYNVSPAKIMMGDTGSLALGAVFAALAMVMKKEILLIIIGGVFVWETLCVIIQISSVKLTGKRVFKYTPIHYSFVLDGIKETRVVKSFWKLAFIFSIIGLLIGLL